MIPLANHLWQSTVFAAIAALLALALRSNHARARYWLWLIASAKFLIPFSLLMSVGSQVRWPAAQAVARPELTLAMRQISQPFPPVQAPIVLAHQGSLLPYLLWAIWAAGFLAVAIGWWRKWRTIRAAVRSASPIAVAEGVPVLSTPALLEPGVFGIFRPVLLLPQGITGHLRPAHLEAIVAHELCHVRRRDNLGAALHMAVEAIFWFHPLVWWLGARLVEEREHACDEEVLRLGGEPEIYAESILKTCQFYLESPLTCMSGISGSDLKKRVVHIMSQHLPAQLSFSRKLLLAAVGMAAVTAPILLGLLNAQPRPSFEVASVKPNKSGDLRIGIENQPNRFRATNVPLQFLIEFAYNIKDSQLSGAPGWIKSERYDVEAKGDDGSADPQRKLTDDEAIQQRRLMVQSLLADRFHLEVRHETKELPIYALVVAKSGAKLQPAANAPESPDVPPPPPPGGPGPSGAKPPRHTVMMGRGELAMSDVPTAQLADVLSRQVGRTVIDNTGLTGTYDIKLKWTPEPGQGPTFKGAGDGAKNDAPPPADAGPSIFTALQEQLGLKLEPRKGPVDLIVVERVERPSAN